MRLRWIDSDTLGDLRALAEMGLPVIASGGVTTMNDIIAVNNIAREVPSLIGTITGRAIYEGTIDVKEACELIRAGSA